MTNSAADQRSSLSAVTAPASTVFCPARYAKHSACTLLLTASVIVGRVYFFADD